MTVEELIEKLKEMPRDAEVVHYQNYSDSEVDITRVSLLEDGTVEIW